MTQNFKEILHSQKGMIRLFALVLCAFGLVAAIAAPFVSQAFEGANTTYTLTFSAPNATVSVVGMPDFVSGTTPIEEGTTVTFTVTPKASYAIKAVEGEYGDGQTIKDLTKTATGYTFAMPAGNATITVTTVDGIEVALTGDNCTFSDADGQEISGTITVAKQQAFVFNVKGNSGYAVTAVQWKVTDGGEFAPVTYDTAKDGYVIPDNITMVNLTIQATTAAGHILTVTQNDAIVNVTQPAPFKSGTTAVADSSEVKFTVSVSLPYTSQKVVSYPTDDPTQQTVIWPDQGKATSYSFEMPAANTTLEVTGERDITIRQDCKNCELEDSQGHPLSTSAPLYHDLAFHVEKTVHDWESNVVAVSYELTNDPGTRKYLSLNPGNNYTVPKTAITGDLTITAEVTRASQLTIDADNATVNFIAPSWINQGDYVAWGSKVQFTVTPNEDYGVTKVSYSYHGPEGEKRTELFPDKGIYSFTMPEDQAEINIETGAAFPLTFASPDHTNITFTNPYQFVAGQKIAGGTRVTFTASAQEGYGIAKISYSYQDWDGEHEATLSSAKAPQYSFTMPEAPTTLTFAVGTKCAITVDAKNCQVYEHNKSAELTSFISGSEINFDVKPNTPDYEVTSVQYKLTGSADAPKTAEWNEETGYVIPGADATAPLTIIAQATKIVTYPLIKNAEHCAIVTSSGDNLPDSFIPGQSIAFLVRPEEGYVLTSVSYQVGESGEPLSLTPSGYKKLYVIQDTEITDSIIITAVAESHEGNWVTTDDGHWQYLVDGKPLASEWRVIDDCWYYFNEDTYMAQDCWQWIGDAWYGFWADGKMCTGWVWDTPYQNWFFCDYASGAMYTNCWAWIGNAWYGFSYNGEMSRGWTWDSAYKNYFFCDFTTGAMYTDCWAWIGNAWYGFWSDGQMCYGWVQGSGNWYYCDWDSGYLYTDCWVNSYWWADASGVCSYWD